MKHNLLKKFIAFVLIFILTTLNHANSQINPNLDDLAFHTVDIIEEYLDLILKNGFIEVDSEDMIKLTTLCRFNSIYAGSHSKIEKYNFPKIKNKAMREMYTDGLASSYACKVLFAKELSRLYSIPKSIDRSFKFNEHIKEIKFIKNWLLSLKPGVINTDWNDFKSDRLLWLSRLQTIAEQSMSDLQSRGVQIAMKKYEGGQLKVDGYCGDGGIFTITLREKEWTGCRQSSGCASESNKMSLEKFSEQLCR